MTQWGLDSLFNPAKRHMDEEKRRLQATRQEVGDSSGGDRIDLESGKVVVRRRAAQVQAETQGDPESEDDVAGSGQAPESESGVADPDSEDEA